MSCSSNKMPRPCKMFCFTFISLPARWETDMWVRKIDRPGSDSVYSYGRDKKVWPPQVEDFCLLNGNHSYWQLISCTFGRGTLFKGFKNQFYSYETGHGKKLYRVVRWLCEVINSPVPVTSGCTFAGTVTLFKGPKPHLFIRRRSYMFFSFSWS